MPEIRSGKRRQSRKTPGKGARRVVGSALAEADRRLLRDLPSSVELATVLSPDRARAVLRVLAAQIEAGERPNRAALKYLAQSIRRFQGSYVKGEPGPSLAKAFGLSRQQRGRPAGSQGRNRGTDEKPAGDLTPDQRIEIASEVEPTRVEIEWERARGEQVESRSTRYEAALERVGKRHNLHPDTVKACHTELLRAQKVENQLVGDAAHSPSSVPTPAAKPQPPLQHSEVERLRKYTRARALLEQTRETIIELITAAGGPVVAGPGSELVMVAWLIENTPEQTRAEIIRGNATP